VQLPYELNINYFDALSNPGAPEPLKLQVDRFMSAQAIMLALVGVPGIYFHSLFGSRSWREGVDLTGRNRTINRQKFDIATFESELADESSLRYQVFQRYAQLLRARSSSAAFHPNGTQQILDSGDAIFALLRLSPDKSQRVLCLHNVSDQPQPLTIINILPPGSTRAINLITEEWIDFDPNSVLVLKPYEILWLQTPER
jgi:sucrose phosphorylase